MEDSIYECILKGMPRERIAEKFKIDLNTISDIAKEKIEYDALSPMEKEKILHTLSLISNKGWQVFDMASIETKAKILDLIRRLTHDRAEILGLTKDTTKVEGSIEISWKKD